MARPHPTTSATGGSTMASSSSSSSSSQAPLLHAAWATALVAVCLALCTIHSRNRRKPTSSSSSSSSRRGPRFAAPLSSRRRGGSGSTRECNGGTATNATAARVSPTPSDTAKAANGAHMTQAAPPRADSNATAAGSGGPVTVIDVGTHGPIAPTVLLPPPPDPIPPRRSLSVKHIRFAERLGRIRSMRRGGSGDQAAPDDDVFVGCRGDGEAAAGEDATLWTKTIILGERCRVPGGGGGEDDSDGDDVMVPWKSYRPRQPRSLPVTRSNSFAGVGSAAACRRAEARF
ncbi:hypothetical protein ACP70R_046562 [Stipagrostis hirtigluma subsp. patula]